MTIHLPISIRPSPKPSIKSLYDARGQFVCGSLDADTAQALMEAVNGAVKWRPASKLPERTKLVLVNCGGSVCIGQYYVNRWIDAAGNDVLPLTVTHWAELPTPPSQALRAKVK